MQQNAAAGLRYSASRGYIHHLKPGGLELQTETLTTRVVLENGRAVGIEVTDISKKGRRAAPADDPGGQGGHPLRRASSARRSC